MRNVYIMLSYFVFPASRRRTKIVITLQFDTRRTRTENRAIRHPYRADFRRRRISPHDLYPLLTLGVLRAISGMDARDRSGYILDRSCR